MKRRFWCRSHRRTRHRLRPTSTSHASRRARGLAHSHRDAGTRRAYHRARFAHHTRPFLPLPINPNTLPTPTHIPIHIAPPWTPILNLNLLQHHLIRPLLEIRQSPRPFNRPLIIPRITARPNPHTNIHRRLRIILPTHRVSIRQRANRCVVDIPRRRAGTPRDSVIPHTSLRIYGRHPLRAIIRRRIPLAKVIRLRLRRIPTDPLPVYFIQVVGLQDRAADDAGAGGGANVEGYAAEKDVPG